MNSLVNPSNALPLYKQVSEILYNKIESQEWKENEKIPSEAMLMEEFDVSRITVRKAISELTESGLLVRSQGRGTFVASTKNIITAQGNIGFTRSCQLAGKRAENIVLECRMEYPTAKEKNFFHIHSTEKIVYIRRLRAVDGVSTVVETLCYAPKFSDLLGENLTGSVTELVETRYETGFGEAHRTVEACAASEEESKLLNVEVGTPMLLIRDSQYDTAGVPMCVSKQIFNTSHLKLYL